MVTFPTHRSRRVDAHNIPYPPEKAKAARRTGRPRMLVPDVPGQACAHRRNPRSWLAFRTGPGALSPSNGAQQKIPVHTIQNKTRRGVHKFEVAICGFKPPANRPFFCGRLLTRLRTRPTRSLKPPSKLADIARHVHCQPFGNGHGHLSIRPRLQAGQRRANLIRRPKRKRFVLRQSSGGRAG